MNVVAVDPGTLEQLKTILRRDLKLGAAAVIADDMPLIGGEMDLDSLDILLLVSSIEKHFGIKIPNEVVGRWAFQNVSTLAKFVQDNATAAGATAAGASRNGTAASGGASGGAGAEATREPDWLGMLPHGPEFRFVSKVTHVTPGKQARGQWTLRGDEPFFAGHFPGNPIVPGVLLIESLSQIAGLASADDPKAAGARAAGARAAGARTDRGGMLAHVDVRLESPVAPPATIELSATIVRTMASLRVCEVVASVSGTIVARGTVAVSIR